MNTEATAMAHRVARPGTVATWLNHWSIQHADWGALSQVSCIGIDGTLLQLLMRRAGYDLGRTSADLVLPILFRDVLPADSAIALIGAAPGVAAKAAARLGTRHRVRAWDGYEQLSSLRFNPEELEEFSPDVIVLGLGAGLQDEVAVEFHRRFPEAVICTSGGWIDQFSRKEQYFPAWVHKFRLGWLWRILHEPRRLLRRYTIDAVSILLKQREYVGRLQALRVEPTPICLEVRRHRP
ncbi:UDP-Gal:alpha-D-GlcNAc-diphosphoundecaprenol beta-1,4-galactosyltransferase [Corynebacterium atrinae]|uniref:WecB/TagA/CpsF family glycosyltransferase n=1 Tax=Corynebacterium atrinae TaxID=1336740 RepID=UPI0025B40F2A|nr:WecB/TagA/CpsF family glycosyltransferase [Corynebacterium atrinae]WJY62520.1 UDP-Gal:alpha-D-GlcNAc-diphosphoundecaprenol beta-1,4-galactosyltransferase [Corynebacterium atrinae]